MNNKNILQVYDTAIVYVKRLANIISGVAMVTLIFSFAWLVFGRYILNDTPTWVEQLSLLLVITISFLTAAVGIHERTHLSVDIFTHMLPPSGQVFIGILADIVMATFGFLMAVNAIDLAEFAWSKKIPLLGISDATRYFPVIISGSLIFVFSVDRIIRSLYSATHPQTINQESK
ncbi:TRAP transporter small permease [Marinomonas sp. 15G1-11]|uniref:TRAP transporter small permease protein n=1 Tax=Marinomonas phaeophyticola TaxID=3004091 RepID=A0ABT4JPT4_9GAMM|nr:TRAP transporter small permease [Marinomonas sp. 15G1-11]MCZ2720161.1 TRAP transporter small permease [Marinomonas sp. 15G1-11]